MLEDVDSGGSDVLVGLQALGVAVQAVAVVGTLWFARRTVAESRNARREEADRFAAELAESREHRRVEAEKARRFDLERRLDRVLENELDDLRWRAHTMSDPAVWPRIDVVARQLRARVLATGLNLPDSLMLAEGDPKSTAAEPTRRLTRSSNGTWGCSARKPEFPSELGGRPGVPRLQPGPEDSLGGLHRAPFVALCELGRGRSVGPDGLHLSP